LNDLSLRPAVSVMMATFVTVADGFAVAVPAVNAASAARASAAAAQGNSFLKCTDSSPFLRFLATEGRKR
jgi:hypothetical protein